MQQVNYLTWTPLPQSADIVAPVTINFAIDLQWFVRLRGSYLNTPIYPQIVTVDNLQNADDVTIAIGPIIATVPSYSRQSIVIPKETTALNLSSVGTGIVNLSFYEKTPIQPDTTELLKLLVNVIVARLITGVDTGTPDNYVINPAPILTSYTTLLLALIWPNNDNTGTAKAYLDISGLGPMEILYNGKSLDSFGAGGVDRAYPAIIKAGNPCFMVFDGLTNFHLLPLPVGAYAPEFAGSTKFNIRMQRARIQDFCVDVSNQGSGNWVVSSNRNANVWEFIGNLTDVVTLISNLANGEEFEISFDNGRVGGAITHNPPFLYLRDGLPFWPSVDTGTGFGGDTIRFRQVGLTVREVSRMQRTVAFKAVMSTVQSITTGAVTKLNLNTTLINNCGFYDTGLMRFVPRPGFYRLSMSVSQTAAVPAGTRFISIIQKNGNLFSIAEIILGGLLGNSCIVTSTVDVANGSDYYEGYVLISGGHPTNIDNNNNRTFFCGEQIS